MSLIFNPLAQYGFDYIGGSSTPFTGYPMVATYADLVSIDPSEHNNEIYIVLSSTGIWPFNDKKGLYYSNGSSWSWLSEAPTTFSDTLFTLVNAADNTKVVKVSLSSITTGTTRTLTVPDNDGTLVTGTGSSNQVAYFDGTNSIAGDTDLTWDSTNNILNITKNEIGLNPSGGLELFNNTLATAIVQNQFSPMLSFKSSAWHTGTPASYSRWISLQGTTGAGVVQSSQLRIGFSNDDITYSFPVTISNIGTIDAGTFRSTANTSFWANVSNTGTLRRLGTYLTAATPATASNKIQVSPRSIWVGNIWNGTLSRAHHWDLGASGIADTETGSLYLYYSPDGGTTQNPIFGFTGVYGNASTLSTVKRLRGMPNIHAQDITTLTDGDWQDYSDANGIYNQQRISSTFTTIGADTVNSTSLKSETAGKVAMVYDTATGEQCLCINVTANEAISKGNVCCYLQGGTNNRLVKVPTSGNENDMPVGVAYTSAAGAGSTFWMAVSGIVQVLPETGVTPTLGYILYTSASVAGTAAQAATTPAALTHFKEIGHWTESAALNTICKAIIHFN